MLSQLKKLAIASLFLLASALSLPALAQEAGGGMDFNFDSSGELDGFGEDGFEFQGDPEAEAAAAGVAIAMLVGYLCFIGLAILLQIFIAYLLYDALNAVPEQYRELESWVPWLLLVPLANIVVLFLAFIKTPRSLAKCLGASGDTTHGDCGESLGLWGAILCVIPCGAIVGIVLLIMALLKINKAKQAVRALA